MFIYNTEDHPPIQSAALPQLLVTNTATESGMALTNDDYLINVTDAVMKQKVLCEMVLNQFIGKIKSECFSLCQLTKPLSPFRKIDVMKCTLFEWKVLVDDLARKAPTLLKILSAV